jgi:hypothetical protein
MIGGELERDGQVVMRFLARPSCDVDLVQQSIGPHALARAASASARASHSSSVSFGSSFRI